MENKFEDPGSVLNEREKWETYIVAHLCHELKIPGNQVAKMLDISPAGISRILKRADELGWLQVRVVEPANINFKDYSLQLQKLFGLKDVRLIQGDQGIFDYSPIEAHNLEPVVSRAFRERGNKNVGWTDLALQSVREAITGELTRKAALYLDERIQDDDSLFISWGRTMRGVVSHLKPTRTLANLKVAPMIGFRGLKIDPFDANTLVSDIAYIYGSQNYYCIPFPAVFQQGEAKVSKAITKYSKIWNDTIKPLMDGATIAITSIGVASKESHAVLTGLVNVKEVERMQSRGAIGEINSWFFDNNGNEMLDESEEEIFPLGFGLKRLKNMVEGNKTVILTAGVTHHRVDVIYAALIGKLANVLITDHITAKSLIERKTQK
ncbi:hypothetical protein JXQ31_05370 [candidate division KSB1 bacterium]|nr:hypothetical protein [candidate division KSB1 bacterium]